MMVIVDTGCANLASVRFAIERLGVTPVISQDADVIANADKLIVPGVGTAHFAMQALAERGLIEVIQNAQQPTLGICLGMQMLGERSSEGDVATLGVIPMTSDKLQSGDLPLPHMGWNQIYFDKAHPLFDGIDNGAWVYFVHSYAMPVGDYTLAKSEYGQAFSAVIGKNHFYGMQFHPEKSGAVGAKLLQNFLEKV
ncbi:imidazole glycerol phosphate synthase subunit HisH [Acinetobacter sp. c3-l95]|uniref:imidazole glycerol phosphate synthase subunit HisH n=1 Tax=Acinetobacter sp. c3-l95 TaxID=3342804 RepID=UPI0035BAAAC1